MSKKRNKTKAFTVAVTYYDETLSVDKVTQLGYANAVDAADLYWEVLTEVKEVKILDGSNRVRWIRSQAPVDADPKIKEKLTTPSLDDYEVMCNETLESKEDIDQTGFFVDLSEYSKIFFNRT